LAYFLLCDYIRVDRGMQFSERLTMLEKNLIFVNYYSLFHQNCVLNIDLFKGYASVYNQQPLPMKKIIKCGVRETCNNFLAYAAEARKKNINGPGIVS